MFDEFLYRIYEHLVRLAILLQREGLTSAAHGLELDDSVQPARITVKQALLITATQSHGIYSITIIIVITESVLASAC